LRALALRDRRGATTALGLGTDFDERLLRQIA
jgi:hypothetical protein